MDWFSFFGADRARLGIPTSSKKILFTPIVSNKQNYSQSFILFVSPLRAHGIDILEASEVGLKYQFLLVCQWNDIIDEKWPLD